MDALSQLALELTQDAGLAERLAAEAKQRATDDAEQRRVLTELVAAEKRDQAARRIERWKALQRKGALAFVPVALAFFIGAALGGGLGITRVRIDEEPDVVVPDAPERAAECRRLLADVKTAEPRLAKLALEQLRAEFPSGVRCRVEGEKIAAEHGL